MICLHGTIEKGALRKTERTMAAMMKMKQPDIAAQKNAYAGE